MFEQLFVYLKFESNDCIYMLTPADVLFKCVHFLARLPCDVVCFFLGLQGQCVNLMFCDGGHKLDETHVTCLNSVYAEELLSWIARNVRINSNLNSTDDTTVQFA